MAAVPHDVVPAEHRDVLQHQVLRDEQHNGRDCHGAESDQEERIAEREVPLGEAVGRQLVVYNTAYALAYALTVVAGATLIFERRSLK